MSTHPNFDNAQPVSLARFPIVLRFAGLHPNDLGRFKMHDKRTGGDLTHVDQASSELNEVLLAGPKWQEVIRAEVKEASTRNLRSNIDALLAKGRKKEAAKVREAGLCDPWQRCEGGPLREGILTVNKAWFGGTGQANWDAAKVEKFKARAMAFLEEHFSDGQLRYASGHADEEAYHLHFVVAVWRERVTANRGCQILLQASMNPLLSNYEDAQTLAGEAFSEIGLKRGDRRAEALRAAKAAQAELPEPRQHVPPSEWRQREVDIGAAKAREVAQEVAAQADIAAQAIIKDARTRGTAAIRKCRKRAIRESQQRKLAAEKEAAAADRRRDNAARMAEADEERAEAARAEAMAASAVHEEIVAKTAPIIDAATKAADSLQMLRAEVGREGATLQDLRSDVSEIRDQKAGIAAEVEAGILERDAITAEVTAGRQEVAQLGQLRVAEEDAVDLARQRTSDLALQTQAAETDLAEVKKKRDATAHELEDVQGQLTEVRKALSLAEKMLRAITEGLDLVAKMVLRWAPENPDGKNNFRWGESAPTNKNEREDILTRIRPGLTHLAPIAGAVQRFADKVLTRERAQLRQDTEAVADLRDDWDEERKALFARILAGDSHGDPEPE